MFSILLKNQLNYCEFREYIITELHTMVINTHALYAKLDIKFVVGYGDHFL